MRPRTDGRETLVAHVNPDLCVSCGVCAGSCAPMGVGPAQRTGRDQMVHIRELIQQFEPRKEVAIVAVLCRNAPLSHGRALAAAGATTHTVSCTGNMHTSAVELALRGGADGVIVFCCPPRDCRGREGPKWLEQRMYHDREAELQPRVDRRRVRLATAAAGGLAGTMKAFDDFRREVSRVGGSAPDETDIQDPECVPQPVLRRKKVRA